MAMHRDRTRNRNINNHLAPSNVHLSSVTGANTTTISPHLLHATYGKLTSSSSSEEQKQQQQQQQQEEESDLFEEKMLTNVTQPSQISQLNNQLKHKGIESSIAMNTTTLHKKAPAELLQNANLACHRDGRKQQTPRKENEWHEPDIIRRYVQANIIPHIENPYIRQITQQSHELLDNELKSGLYISIIYSSCNHYFFYKQDHPDYHSVDKSTMHVMIKEDQYDDDNLFKGKETFPLNRYSDGQRIESFYHATREETYIDEQKVKHTISMRYPWYTKWPKTLHYGMERIAYQASFKLDYVCPTMAQLPYLFATVGKLGACDSIKSIDLEIPPFALEQYFATVKPEGRIEPIKWVLPIAINREIAISKNIPFAIRAELYSKVSQPRRIGTGPNDWEAAERVVLWCTPNGTFSSSQYTKGTGTGVINQNSILEVDNVGDLILPNNPPIGDYKLLYHLPRNVSQHPDFCRLINEDYVEIIKSLSSLQTRIQHPIGQQMYPVYRITLPNYVENAQIQTSENIIQHYVMEEYIRFEKWTKAEANRFGPLIIHEVGGAGRYVNIPCEILDLAFKQMFDMFDKRNNCIDLQRGIYLRLTPDVNPNNNNQKQEFLTLMDTILKNPTEYSKTFIDFFYQVQFQLEPLDTII